MKKIIVDVFGGDNAPDEILLGVKDALLEKGDFIAVLCGFPDIIDKKIKELGIDEKRVEILPAASQIGCDEEPTKAIRYKTDSSICVAFKALKENDDYDAFISAGSTGAVLAGATLRLGRIKGVNRPALCSLLPTVDGDKKTLFLDAGANADCKPINLVQFAVMGSIYMKALGVDNPTVGLLSNGTENEKGNALNKEAFPLLSSLEQINFIGNVEARDILFHKADVIVTDGFSGNVTVKGMEGAIKALLKMLKENIYSSARGKLGGALLKPTFKKVNDKMDYEKQGGGYFIGVNKTVIKAHGSSKRFAFKNALLQAAEYVDFNVKEKIEAALSDME